MIISVSRRTDIPAFYSDWFYNRIKAGFVYVRNPINKNLISKISLLPEDVDCFVFWTKNPNKFIERLSELEKYKYYFQFTINSYGKDIEPSVPKKKEIIDSFIKLSNVIGKEKVIWRYDPILLNANYNFEYHIKYFEVLAQELNMYTDKCVISFIDLYKKSERNLNGYDIKELTSDEILNISKSLKDIATKYNLNLETCAETIELESLNINHNRCIDNILIEKILNKRLKVTKDKNQRDICGCIESIDIGAYNTCRHGCLYCYANFNKEMVIDNFSKHSINSPLIFGDIEVKDVIKERKNKSIIVSTLFG
jgi:DNA repair photolyase